MNDSVKEKNILKLFQQFIMTQVQEDTMKNKPKSNVSRKHCLLRKAFLLVTRLNQAMSLKAQLWESAREDFMLM